MSRWEVVDATYGRNSAGGSETTGGASARPQGGLEHGGGCEEADASAERLPRDGWERVGDEWREGEVLWWMRWERRGAALPA